MKQLYRIIKRKELLKESVNRNINCLFIDEKITLEPEHKEICFDSETIDRIRKYSEYDVIEIKDNNISLIFDANSTENAILLTNKCNSNCIMCPCSESWRTSNLEINLEDILDLIHYLPSNTRFLCLTGGEPTLIKNGFIDVLKEINLFLPNTCIFVLTNGRTFSNDAFAREVINSISDNVLFAVPLYGYDAISHDSITQVENSFVQTNKGIRTLIKNNCNVEIRIVINKMNYFNINKIAQFIIENYKGIKCVHFMAMEMMGAAAMNKDKVWVDYTDCFEHTKEAIRGLIKNGFDVELYNFPLCTVEKEFWSICKKSISNYKADYAKECDCCKMKEMCGGVFRSTLKITRMELKPIS